MLGYRETVAMQKEELGKFWVWVCCTEMPASLADLVVGPGDRRLLSNRQRKPHQAGGEAYQ